MNFAPPPEPVGMLTVLLCAVALDIKVWIRVRLPLRVRVKVCGGVKVMHVVLP